MSKKVLIVESLPSLVNGVSVATINIIGFTAFAYDFGAGGLISKAYSFYKNNTKYFVSYDEFFKNPDLLALILTIVCSICGNKSTARNNRNHIFPSLLSMKTFFETQCFHHLT